MKTINILIFSIIFLTINLVYGQKNYAIISHSIIINGTSNLHDWTAKVLKAKGSCFITKENNNIEISNIEVIVDANTFESSGGSIMDSKMNKALKSEEYPNIIFKADKTNKIVKIDKGFSISTTGKLTISGKSKLVSIDSFGSEVGEGVLLITSIKNLKMTEFGIEPPTAIFGTLTTGDEISIDFNVVFKKI